MKQYYSKGFKFLAFLTLIFYLPPSLQAQCLCADGKVPQTEVHTMPSAFQSNKSTIFSMPRFNPSTGTLICVNAKAYVTTILRLKLENEDPSPINYRIKYTRWDTLSGPNIVPDVTSDLVKYYGPFLLDGSDGNTWSGPDYKAIGPDTIYKQKLFEGTTSDVTGYMGAGTVDFTYKTGAQAYPDQGGDFLLFGSFPLNKVEFYMTYSYCSASTLPLDIQNFQAKFLDKDNVNLTWRSQEESKNNPYEIEISLNGTTFNNIGISTGPVDGSSTEYQYQYHLDKPAGGKLYFRLKQKTGSTYKYSIVRVLETGTSRSGGVRIYPNPVVRRISMEFDEPLNGE